MSSVSPLSTSFRSFRRSMMRARGVVSLGVSTGSFGGTSNWLFGTSFSPNPPTFG